MNRAAVFLCAPILAFSVWGCNSRAEAAAEPPETAADTAAEETTSAEEETQLKISIKANGNTIVYGLNGSQAAADLYAQLPLTLEVENFSTNEKVFYPPQKLDTASTPMADAGKGTLAYYAPWGDVVMFYDHFGQGSGLYELGEVISGEEFIENLAGTVEITAAGGEN